MRRIDIIALIVILSVISLGVTYYIAVHPIRPQRDDKIQIGVQEPIQKLSPSEILKPRKPSLTPEEGTSASTKESPAETTPTKRTVIVHPKWQTGVTHVEGAYPVTKPGNFISPVWSPLGLDIAFTTLNQEGIWLAGPNSVEGRRLIDDKLGSPDFFWSADGMQLFLITVDQRPVAVMLSGEKYPVPELRRSVYEREGNIYFVDEDGNITRITGSQDRFYAPRLSPDESLVAYCGYETGIHISTTDGKHTISVGKGEHPSWLPDSSGIVYDVPVSDGLRIIDGDLWYAAADGTERSNLTNSPGIAESYPAVSPDGARIAFIAEGTVYVGKFVRSRR